MPLRVACDAIQSASECHLGLVGIGCNFGRIGVGPYPTLSDPISIPCLAATCRMRLYRIRIRMLCGLFRIGCGSDRIGVGPYLIRSDPTPGQNLAVTCRMRLCTARFRPRCGLFQIGCKFGRSGVGPYPSDMRALSGRIRFWPHRCWALPGPFGSDAGLAPDTYVSDAVL